MVVGYVGIGKVIGCGRPECREGPVVAVAAARPGSRIRGGNVRQGCIGNQFGGEGPWIRLL